MPIPYGGDRWTEVGPELAAAYEPGDQLIVEQEQGALLHVPAAVRSIVTAAVDRAVSAFAGLATVPDSAITDFFEHFAQRIEDETTFAPISAANADDVARAAAAGRSTTRLELTATMRADMVAGLRTWRDLPGGRDTSGSVVEHDGWRVEERRAPLGVIAFVFEGRPNVFADATGVLRTGNTVVFRIGSDALGTARAIVTHALDPALHAAGLPPGAVSLVESPERSAGWSLFSDRRLSLAVARGSGPAVAQLGSVARQAGVPVSLHGTGGAWLVAGEHADAARFSAVVRHSLDRKVCNTLNVCCITRARAHDLVPLFLDALESAARARGTSAKLHVVDTSADAVPAAWFERRVAIARAEGDVVEPQADRIAVADLAVEWEWERSPEASLVLIDDVADAVALFNTWSPRFGISIVSESPDEQEFVWAASEAPFVGDGFTRWVDGQFALDKPELGLSNWQHGRLLARSGILSGDSVFSVRLRVQQRDPDLHR